jgi:hypothetical protein
VPVGFQVTGVDFDLDGSHAVLGRIAGSAEYRTRVSGAPTRREGPRPFPYRPPRIR